MQNVIVPFDPDILGLDGDPSLPFEIHRVEVLRPHIAGVHGAGELEDSIRQRGLAVVDMSDDREVAQTGQVHGRA